MIILIKDPRKEKGHITIGYMIVHNTNSSAYVAVGGGRVVTTGSLQPVHLPIPPAVTEEEINGLRRKYATAPVRYYN